MIEQFTEAQIQQYRDDGFLIVENLIDMDAVMELRERYDRIFDGQHDLVVWPDEYYWQKGRDPVDAHRVLAGLWRADPMVAKHTFSGPFGELACQLEGASSARLWADVAMYKPEGGKPFDIHQDAAFMCWVDPVWNWTCWIALDDTYADGGTLVYVKGSHKWGPQPAPGTTQITRDTMEGWTDYVQQFAPEGEEVELVPLVFGAGSAGFHTGWIWHGSGPNTRPGNIRRSYSIHMIPATSRHHPRIRHRAYSRYFAPGQQDFDDNFFPVLWSENGYRTPWLDGYAGQETPIDAFSSDAVLTLGDEQINVEPWAAAAG
ncbi:MAG: phytanoyl-CoA dioxygenase family protein [Acidimicrobiia bacterium]|nr:phytanoyl-CoA dioxygenase family protein [Acidimicrobiia bacterium]